MEKINKGEIQRLFPILKAIKEGKTIQWNDMGVWCDIDGDDEGFVLDTLIGKTDGYRIKPESKYRPFKDEKECWQEMQKHQPIGWITSQDGEVKSLIILIDNEGLVIGDRNNGVMGFVTATDLFKIKFADGTPFDIKEEE